VFFFPSVQAFAFVIARFFLFHACPYHNTILCFDFGCLSTPQLFAFFLASMISFPAFGIADKHKNDVL